MHEQLRERNAPTEWTDAKLAAAIAEGSPRAERVFLERFYRRVVALLTARTRDSAVVEVNDLAQETMVRALIGLRGGRLSEGSSLSSWVGSIALRTASSAQRREVYRAHERIDNVRPICPEPEPVAMVEGIQRQDLANQAMDTLGEPARSIVRAFFIDGLSRGEIERRFKLDGPELSRVLYRAKMAMRRTIETFERRGGRS